jgi:F-box-like
MEVKERQVNSIFTFNDQGELIDGISSLPLELALTVFSFLPKKDLLTCSQSAKSWQVLSENKELWKQTIESLEIDQSNNLLTAISKKIAHLKKIAKETDSLLNKNVKTMHAFDLEYFRITENDNYKIKNGCYANLLLMKVGLATLDKVKMIATVLKEKYYSEEGWQMIANEMVKIGNYDEALQITNSLEDKSKICKIISEIIYILIFNKDRLEDAINIYKTYQSKLTENSDALDSILCYAFETNQLDNIESVIDVTKFSRKKSKAIIQLLERLLKEKNENKVKLLIQKYSDNLKSDGARFASSLIKIYVSVGDNEKAWDLALKNKDSDKYMLYTLRNAFLNLNLNEEVKKVNDMINVKK